MKKVVKTVSLILILSIILSVSSLATIVPCSSDYIYSGHASITKGTGGSITIMFDVIGYGTMTKLGALSIKLYTSSGSLVKTFSASNSSNLMGSNVASYSGSVSYAGTSGTSYYAVVTFYASNNSGTGTSTFTTPTVTA
jgi:hypothetical protein